MDEAREGGSSRRTSEAACDHCNEEAAILYCRADSAKLCVICDQHVHSANPLSLKHIRSQICDNCRSQPVSFHCVSDNLLLCQDCDSDAHSSVIFHTRFPVRGFTGCPSPSQLASHWGLDFTKLLLQHHHHLSNTNRYHYDDDDDGDDVVDDQFMVPNTLFTKGLPQSSTATITSTCGKHKHIIIKQLIHLLHTQQQHNHFQNHHQAEEEEEEEEEEEDDGRQRRRRFMTSVNDDNDDHSLLLTQSLPPQQLPFTSQQQVSTSTSQLNVMNQGGGFQQAQGAQMLWNTHPSHQGTQVYIVSLPSLLPNLFSVNFMPSNTYTVANFMVI